MCAECQSADRFRRKGTFSLLDMLRFYAQDFLTIARTMGQTDQTAEMKKLNPAFDKPLPDDVRTNFKQTLNNFDDICRHVNLESARDQITRMLDKLGDPYFTEERFSKLTLNYITGLRMISLTISCSRFRALTRAILSNEGLCSILQQYQSQARSPAY
jgi:hypothetical protein